ncbi:MAG: hypothetical protein CM15mP1_3970 [Methanobacteriota archaeon]|nr:MAG: hypothetical protein CM15mP1_3970 [Euryarchaeota archaeon]
MNTVSTKLRRRAKLKVALHYSEVPYLAERPLPNKVLATLR